MNPMRSWLLAGVAGSLLPICLPGQVLPQGFSYRAVVPGNWPLLLDAACTMAFAPDGRLFVCERLSGQIKVVKDGVVQPQPWHVVSCLNQLQSERGLLGIAIDPGFLVNGYVYVFYTDANSSTDVIARIQDVQGVGVNHTVLTPPAIMPALFEHRGGRMAFGPDGKLYVSVGDGGDTTTPQNPAVWPGKILRLNAPGLTVPLDNPFAGSPAYSLGHRNVFGLAFHPHSGSLYASEAGGPIADEVNRVLAGGNCAHPLHEGLSPPMSGFVDPLVVYPSQPTLTGISFYDGDNYPGMSNDLFSCRWIDGEVHRLRLSPTGDSVVSDTVFDDLGHAFDIQMGPDGNLWVLHSDPFTWAGGIEIGRYEHATAPVPSVHMMAVSGPALGGSITLGFTATNGDMIVPWLGLSRYTPPLALPIGPVHVSFDAQLPVQMITNDNRAYLGVPLPQVPALVGLPLFAQALRISPASFRMNLTKSASLVLR